jgi:hypothetical protein
MYAWRKIVRQFPEKTMLALVETVAFIKTPA